MWLGRCVSFPFKRTCNQFSLIKRKRDRKGTSLCGANLLRTLHLLPRVFSSSWARISFGIRAMAGEGSRTPSRSPGRRGASTSPIRRGRSLTRRGGREVVVQQHVVHQASSTVVYPELTATNYFEWALIMKVNIEVQRVWDAVEGAASYSEDRAATPTIRHITIY